MVQLLVTLLFLFFVDDCIVLTVHIDPWFEVKRVNIRWALLGGCPGGLCSVFTPYYAEDVMYDLKKLCEENKDGISILFYLQKIYPGICFLYMC